MAASAGRRAEVAWGCSTRASGLSVLFKVRPNPMHHIPSGPSGDKGHGSGRFGLSVLIQGISLWDPWHGSIMPASELRNPVLKVVYSGVVIAF